MEIEDYCDNKAESIDLYHLQSLQYSLDRAQFRAVFTIRRSASAYAWCTKNPHELNFSASIRIKFCLFESLERKMSLL